MRNFKACLCGMAALLGVSVQAGPGFFSVAQMDGRWWLIDPQGQRFISKGVTTVGFAQDRIQNTNRAPYGEANQAKYGSLENWRAAAARRLIGWNFNTLGAWSDDKLTGVDVAGKRLAVAPILDFGAGFAAKHGNAWLHGIFPDVFDPAFEEATGQRAREHCGPRQNDPRVLGWFTDNELRWGPDWRGQDELLTLFLALPTNAPGKRAAISLLRDRHGDITKFNAVWHTQFTGWDQLAAAPAVKPPVVDQKRHAQNAEVASTGGAFLADCDAFLGQLAERYFRITSAALRAADPNHLNFGCRFAYVPRPPVITAAAKYLDAISFNCYAHDPRGTIDRYAVFGKPVIIGEFAFRGEDSGLPNTKGAGPKVKTQTDRAAAFQKYVTAALGHPNLVGYHWFEHADEPQEGRFDGENSNYGVVNIKDEPYPELTRAMTALNAQAEHLHATAR